ncbi:MAG: ParA family protein [Blastocatellia bacterium]|nr:ParA family protein [Blastocatellia bacterium]
MSTIIAIANQKGGVGKTTTAVNLASFLAQQQSPSKMPARVLLVDCDPQGHVARSFAIDSNAIEKTIYTVLFGRCDPPDAIREVRANLEILPANRELAIGEIELREVINRERRLKQLLLSLPQYDYIIIDCPPGLNLLTINALAAAQVVLIPVSTWLALTGIGDLAEVLAELVREFNLNVTLYAVQTFFRLGVRESESLRERLKADFGGNLLNSTINLNTTLATASAEGRPIIDYPNTPGYTDYARLAKEVITRVTKENKATRKIRKG